MKFICLLEYSPTSLKVFSSKSEISETCLNKQRKMNTFRLHFNFIIILTWDFHLKSFQTLLSAF